MFVLYFIHLVIEYEFSMLVLRFSYIDSFRAVFFILLNIYVIMFTASKINQVNLFVV